MKGEATTILLPVYGRAELLAEAWASLQAQTDSHWQLLIADDGSDGATAAWIAAGPARDPRTIWIRRSQNLGLFANLNAALETLAEGSWVLLLCSDDRLLPHAVAGLNQLRLAWPQARWIISTHRSIGPAGEALACTSAIDHGRFAPSTRMIPAAEFVPLLLQYGSLNGNLTGIAFSLDLWRAAGPFRPDWSHAADWEWLIRAGEQAPVLLNREPLAEVRSHPAQLSNANRRGGEELREVAAVQRLLMAHPLLQLERRRRQWAAHRLHFQLWNLLKDALRGRTKGLREGLEEIQGTVGIGAVLLALVAWLPQRWQLRRRSRCSHPGAR